MALFCIAPAIACGIQGPIATTQDKSAPHPEFITYEQSSGEGVDSSAVRFVYSEPELEEERRTNILVEIDRIEGMTLPCLSVSTREGAIDLAKILDDVGLKPRLFWSDEVPATELGDELWPTEETLQKVMRRFRNITPRPDEWSIYVLLIPRRAHESEFSIMIDPTHRSGCVVSMPASPKNQAELLHTIGHEVGHLLNLPHPWEVYGNTRSLMSYPWRWKNWDWADPAIYHFDAAGRHHILYGPESRIRPGASSFDIPILRENIKKIGLE